MRLSQIIPEMGITKARITREKPFALLALSISKISQPHCIFIDDEKYASDISNEVTMVITCPTLEQRLQSAQYGLCVIDKPREFFFALHNYLAMQEGYRRSAFVTEIGKDSSVSQMASISPSNVRIGRQVLIEEFVVIRPNTSIGDYSVIRAGSVIGGQGYEFKRSNGSIMSVEHAGGVVIGSHAEIQHNTCIDRAIYPWDDTIIGDYSKLDNLIHIAHAVKIDCNVMVVAQSGIGGRTKIHADAWIGFGATVSNGLEIGHRSRVNIGSIATRDVANNHSVTGNFAIDHARFIENIKKATAD